MSNDSIAKVLVDYYYNPKKIEIDKKKVRSTSLTVRLKESDLVLLDIICGKLKIKRAELIREFIKLDSREMFAALDMYDRHGIGVEIDHVLRNEYEYDVSLVREIEYDLYTNGLVEEII